MLELRTWGTAVLVLLAAAIAPVSDRTLAATSDANLSTAVYLSDGSRFPGWSQWSDRDGGWIDGTPWVAGDFNGDRKADLATVWNNGGSNTITVSLSTGSGFRRSHWATNAGGWMDTTKWAAGDFNGDGKSDIAASWNNGGNLSTAVYLSDGSRFPGWSQWSDRDGGWIDGTPWVAGDFNGDRKADLATVWNNGGSNTITVSLSTGSGFRRSHWATNAGGWMDTTKWAAGDFNGDGKSDIAASWANGDTSGPGDCQKAEERYAGYVDKVPRTDAEVVNAEHALLHLVNVERSQRGLAPLCFNDHLAPAARAHSENWATAPDRSCPSNRNWSGCGHWDSRAGYAWPEDRIAKSGYGAYSAMSENTQNGGGRSDGTNVVPAGWTWGTPKAAVYWWMNHDPQNNYANNGHRKAILDPRFKDAGPGVGRYTDRFGNRAATFTLMFGVR
ncbi:FG-GAP-like repeat-containing protein (plasmid) [Streptomyces xanthophaeus]|uniref:FG-GAP-like repeat-containing protein n=1 Tax=Streptomyces xanthophaeus TaxID=67385 RepID=UPI00398FE852